MQKKPIYPQRPIRAKVIAFTLLVALLGSMIFFLPVEQPRPIEWPLVLGYCFALSFASMGLVRISGRLQALWGALILLAFAPAVVSALMLNSIPWSEPADNLDNIMLGFLIARYLFWAVGVVGVILVAWGWNLYRCDSHAPPALVE